MFKPVGNLQTNNGKRIVKWAHGQMRLGRPEPIWFDCIARLHPPLSFATAPTGHRLPNLAATGFKPKKIVFPEDGVRRQMARARAHQPVELVGHSGPRDRHPPAPACHETERLSREFLQEEAALLDQAARLERLKKGSSSSSKRK